MSLLILSLSITWSWVFSFTPRPLYLPENYSRYPLYRRLCINLFIVSHVDRRTWMKISVISTYLNCLLFYGTSVIDVWTHLRLKMLKICTHLYYMTHDNSEISYVICQDDPSWPVNILSSCSRLAAINTLPNHFSFLRYASRALAPVAGNATSLILCWHPCQRACRFRNCFALRLILSMLCFTTQSVAQTTYHNHHHHHLFHWLLLQLLLVLMVS
jgi:hypothetical protein